MINREKGILPRLLFESPDEGGASGGASSTPAAPATSTPTEGLPGWHAGLPDELKGHELLKDKKTVGDLGRQFLELSERQKSALFVPGENATAEERNRFYEQLGRPQSKDGYTFPEFKDLPKDEEFEDWYRDTVYQLGLSNDAAARLYQSYGDWVAKGLKARQNQAAEALKAKYGEKAQETLERTRTALRTLADPEFAQYLDETGLGNDVRMVDFVAKLAAKFKDAFVPGTPPAPEVDEEREMLRKLYPSLENGGRVPQ